MSGELIILLQIIMIDLVMAGDNAIIIAMAANGLPKEQRNKVIYLGLSAAVGLRIVFALLAVYLLAIPGLTLVGGLLLAWVCWRFYKDIRAPHTMIDHSDNTAAPSKTLLQAVIQIIIADVSMSLDNVLAVAGAAKDHTTMLVIGLVIAIVLMAVASKLIANLLLKHKWIAWLGLGVILWVCVDMLHRGFLEVLQYCTSCGQFIPGLA